jgi:hypothetical protein
MQHANEMFDKLCAMFGRNKSEIWAGIFAATSNGFLLLGREAKQETDKDVETPSESLQEEEPNSEPEDDNEGPTCRKRYYQVNKKELMQIEIVAHEKGQQIAALAVALGPEEFTRQKENIKNQLTSKEEKYRKLGSIGWTNQGSENIEGE